MARATGSATGSGELRRNAVSWLLGIVFVYSIMFATGGVIFHRVPQILLFGTTLVVSGALLLANLAREKAST